MKIIIKCQVSDGVKGHWVGHFRSYGDKTVISILASRFREPDSIITNDTLLLYPNSSLSSLISTIQLGDICPLINGIGNVKVINFIPDLCCVNICLNIYNVLSTTFISLQSLISPCNI